MKKNEKETQELAVEANFSVNGEEDIAKRAYELWQQRNYEYGNDLADWFEAERELKGRD
jgi:hypothetical protein